jgi:two-component system, LytTR family, sensor kinase
MAIATDLASLRTAAREWVAGGGALAHETRRAQPRRIGLLMAWAGATLLYSVLLMEQRQIEFSLALTLAAVRFSLLALLGIPTWRYCRRLLDNPPSRLRLIAAHVLMGSAVLGVWMAGYLPLSALLYGQTLAERVESIAPLQYLEFVLTYTLMASGIVTVLLSQRLEAQRRREAELLALTHEAELRALKAQIRPHFLFNVLNSIYSLIGSRPEQAREMVDLVADLMRRTLDASEEQFVEVGWEMQVVDRYLRIEKVRLGARVEVTVRSEGVPADAMISPLLLQPLVENAVKHGVGAQPGPGRVDVEAKGGGDVLEFVIRDTGPGLRGASHASGHGLSLTRRRLEALYGSAYSLELRDGQPRGVEVRLRIPAYPPGARRSDA